MGRGLESVARKIFPSNWSLCAVQEWLFPPFLLLHCLPLEDSSDSCSPSITTLQPSYIQPGLAVRRVKEASGPHAERSNPIVPFPKGFPQRPPLSLGFQTALIAERGSEDRKTTLSFLGRFILALLPLGIFFWFRLDACSRLNIMVEVKPHKFISCSTHLPIPNSSWSWLGEDESLPHSTAP